MFDSITAKLSSASQIFSSINETLEDFFEKASAIFNGDDSFDTRVQIGLDLSNDDLLKIALMAHERDITFNQMLEVMLRSVMDEHKVNDE